MRLTMKERKKATAVVAPRYKKARKKEKGVILDEFVELTGYDRRYAAYVLRSHGRRVWIGAGRAIVGDVRKVMTRKKPRVYDDAVFEELKKVWHIMDCICGKRLVSVLREIVPRLERFGEITVDAEVKAKLFRISAATADRLLSGERRKQAIKGRSNTKPGTLLKHQIPVRTFSDWDEQRPGFAEIDLVGHDGGNASGQFAHTLDVTDICTTWTETEAVRNKAEKWVFDALKDIRKRMPFPLLGIDSDSGSEFINHHLFRYCKQEGITFTRTRSGRKNDNCFVEQKNYSIVRRNVGYARYDTEEQLCVLNEIYRHLRLYTNFFLPTMKLIQKTRIGSKVIKRYDKPSTPYRRVLASTHVSAQDKENLKKQYAKLNPAQLKRQIERLKQKLLRLSSMRPRKAAA